MDSAIQIFNFQDKQVRVVEKDGEPWWVAKDVCAILGFENPSDALKYLDDDERTLIINPSLAKSHNGQVSLVNEPGIYSLVLRSRKPESKAFKRWVTHEVLPTIRKHGAYMTPQKIEEVLFNPDLIIRLAQNLKDEQIRRQELQTKIEIDAPKVLFADAVATSHSDINVGDLAKLICQNGYNIGQNPLYIWLRENGYIMKEGTSSSNMPTQRALEMGLFRVKETAVVTSSGTTVVKKTPKVTPKGQQYFINKFLGMGLRVA